MLHIITPNDRPAHADLLSKMFAHMNSESAGYAYQKDEFDAPDAVYCVYVDDRAGILGSARLLPRATLLADRMELEEVDADYWEGNRVFFDLDENSPIHEDPEAFSQITQQFYRGLYEGIEGFAKTSGISSILFVNPVDEHEDMTYFGQWPFEIESLIEIKVGDESDTYAVGGCRFN